ncbi:MAG TPA: NUDIX domain-containing protein [Acidimicrobiales bacterium]|nr:NUDIX domain-containing protein [Acidimicrobiales bacterium]
MSTTEDLFFEAVAARELVRPSVRAIVVQQDRLLLQRPVDVPDAYAFVGGEYEFGDTFDTRIRREFEEETTAKVISWSYLFVVENRFLHGGRRLQTLEHYLEVQIDREDVDTREGHLVHEWISREQLPMVNLRPRVVRDALAEGGLPTQRHLVFDGWLSK